jgi:hypothetical protein
MRTKTTSKATLTVDLVVASLGLLIGAIETIGLAIAQELFVHALTIAALELIARARTRIRVDALVGVLKLESEREQRVVLVCVCVCVCNSRK